MTDFLDVAKSAKEALAKPREQIPRRATRDLRGKGRRAGPSRSKIIIRLSPDGVIRAQRAEGDKPKQ